MRILFLVFCSALLLFAKVGVVSALNGEAQILRDDSNIGVEIGSEIEEKDVIKTFEATTLQLLFDDETVITVGKNSEFKIEEYLFDESENSNAKFGASKGFFKAITGKIGKVSPDKFKIKTKNATIGIRGTHILGSIEDDMEKIACTNGAIFLDVNGVVFDVVQGQMTTISSLGIPSTPRDITAEDFNNFNSGLSTRSGGMSEGVVDRGELRERISTIKLDPANLKPNAEELQSIIDDINALAKNKDEQVELLDELDTTLQDQLDEYYASIYNKIDTTESMNARYSPINSFDDFAGVSFGYYTDQEVSKTAQGYMVQGVVHENLASAITAAKPEEMFREDPLTTPTSTISDLMGLENGTFDHWDGRGGDREVVEYIGKSIGFHSLGNIAIENNENNEIYLMFDYGNRRVVGYLSFDIQNQQSGELEPYRIGIVSMGGEVVNPANFYTEDVIPISGSKNVVWANTIFSKYHGKDANQISSYVESVVPADESGENFNSILSLFVASRVDKIGLGEQNIVKKHTIKSDDYFNWGYWESEGFNAESLIVENPNRVYGGFIDSKFEETSQAKIDEYISKGAKASYSGDIIGSVHEYMGGTSLIENGTIGLDFDFGANSVGGNLEFQSGGKEWMAQITSGVIEKNGFIVNGLDSSMGIDKQIVSADMNGKFFGADAQIIGGGFNLISSDLDMAIGAFGATKR